MLLTARKCCQLTREWNAWWHNSTASPSEERRPTASLTASCCRYRHTDRPEQNEESALKWHVRLDMEGATLDRGVVERGRGGGSTRAKGERIKTSHSWITATDKLGDKGQQNLNKETFSKWRGLIPPAYQNILDPLLLAEREIRSTSKIGWELGCCKLLRLVKYSMWAANWVCLSYTLLTGR